MEPITLTIAAITAATKAISAGNKAKQDRLKREWQQSLAALNQEEQRRLEKQIAETKSAEERKRILAETLGKATEARISAIEAKKLEVKQTKNKLYIIASVAGAILIVGLIIVYAKNKK